MRGHEFRSLCWQVHSTLGGISLPEFQSPDPVTIGSTITASRLPLLILNVLSLYVREQSGTEEVGWRIARLPVSIKTQLTRNGASWRDPAREYRCTEVIPARTLIHRGSRSKISYIDKKKRGFTATVTLGRRLPGQYLKTISHLKSDSL